MEKVRTPNDTCINCGSQFPIEARKRHDNGFYWYECPKCLHTIVQGIVSNNGEFARTSRCPPSDLQDVHVGDDTDWTTWEMWWTGMAHVAAFNGRVVEGKRALLNFVDQL